MISPPYSKELCCFKRINTSFMKKSDPKACMNSSKQSPLVEWTLVIKPFLNRYLTPTQNSTWKHINIAVNSVRCWICFNSAQGKYNSETSSIILLCQGTPSACMPHWTATYRQGTSSPITQIFVFQTSHFSISSSSSLNTNHTHCSFGSSFYVLLWAWLSKSMSKLKVKPLYCLS